MLVDKYEVMWLGSQKSVRWFCLALIFLKKKEEEDDVCVPFKLPNTFQSFLFFILPWHTCPLLFDRVLPYPAPIICSLSDLPDPCSHSPGWPPFFWLSLGWWCFSEFPPQTQFFSYMYLLWKSHLLLQLQKQCSDLVINHKYTYWPLFLPSFKFLAA